MKDKCNVIKLNQSRFKQRRQAQNDTVSDIMEDFFWSNAPESSSEKKQTYNQVEDAAKRCLMDHKLVESIRSLMKEYRSVNNIPTSALYQLNKKYDRSVDIIISICLKLEFSFFESE